MAAVRFSDVLKRYGEVDAVRHLSLEIADGEFMVLVGPSGSGKTTALRMLAGLESISGGEISIGERVVNRIAPRERDIAMVFQDYALYPQMTVFDNLAFGLRRRKVPKEEIAGRVATAAGLLDIGELLERKPGQLSGGQAQRVALGRALVRQPQVFLMDEPLSNLDAKLRVSTRSQIASLQRRLDVTTVYVTHDQVEAMTMGDRVAVLKDGLLQQVDTPLNLYDRPRNAFVAGFIGSPAMNLMTGTVTEEAAKVGDLTIPLDAETRSKLGGDKEVTVGIRPEAFTRVGADEPGLDATINVVEELGADAFVYASLVGSDEGEIVARHDARSVPERGKPIRLGVLREKVHLFSVTTGERLPD